MNRLRMRLKIRVWKGRHESRESLGSRKLCRHQAVAQAAAMDTKAIDS